MTKASARPRAPRPPVAAKAVVPPRAPLARRNLPLLLLMARERVLRRFRAALLAQGLTEPQWRIVRVLHDLGPLEPREIGTLCCISSASLVGVLTRMDEQGLVRRERMDHDQRRVQVALTAHSRRLVQRLAPKIEQAYQRLDEALGADFVRDLHARLDRAIDALDQVSTSEDDLEATSSE